MSMQPGSNLELPNSVPESGGDLKAKWEALDTPIKIGLAAGVVITFAVFARYILPAMLAAMGIGLVLALLFVPYWLPTIIAFFRGHPNKMTIGLLNFFLGWTFVGWWVSLFWALSNPSQQQVNVVVNTTASAGGGMIVQGHPPSGMTPAYQPQPVFESGPAYPQAPPPPGAQLPQYRVGDVVNGYRFDGGNWVPLPDPPQQQIGQTPTPE